jgi:membrane-bound serine protease (ClpP class)
MRDMMALVEDQAASCAEDIALSPIARWTGALFAAVIGAAPIATGPALAERAVLLDIDGIIGPAIADYVTRELGNARSTEARLVILRMNTPGGLDTSMRDIVGAILSSPVPVVAYVAPSGARAASAGTYIAYASAMAAMAPGTNLGAATPVRLGGSPLSPGANPQPAEQSAEPKDAESRKAINDATAYIKSLAELNRRNADWAVDSVRGAASLSASEALRLHVVDVIADDIPDLLQKLDGHTVIVAGKPLRLAAAGLAVTAAPPGWRTELLAVVTNPNIAFMLMLIGIYGLIFEFLSPGAVAPGLIGAISLMVALYALDFLPINYAGAGLVLLGIVLMIAEAHIGAFGAIGIAGIVAFVVGSIMLFPAGDQGFGLSLPVVAGATIATAAFFLVGLSLLLRSRRRPVVVGGEALLGLGGEVVAWTGMEGRVRVAGEIWGARAATELAAGNRVKVVDRDGLTLVVDRA